MLGLVFIYFIGKYFYQLAEEFNKNAWLYAILGVVSYYASTMIGGFILGIIFLISGNDVENVSDQALGLLGVPFGILGCIGLYFLLRKLWSKKKVMVNDDLLDSEAY